jgi:hypothetical protein
VNDDRLSDELVARVANLQRPQYGDAQAFVLLAREVQRSRRVLAAIRALPDELDASWGAKTRETFGYGWVAAMRQVKALLEDPT